MYPSFLRLLPVVLGGLAVAIAGWVLIFNNFEENRYKETRYNTAYEPWSFLEENEDCHKCPVCLEIFKNFNYRDLIWFPCNHIFCKKCTETLFSLQENTCPVCRRSIPVGFISQFKKNYMDSDHNQTSSSE